MDVLSSQDRFKLISTNIELLSDDFAKDVKQGLSADPKYLSSKYFYDEKGSQLFEQITDLEEYYLTRAEHDILKSKSTEIASLFKDDVSLIELGSGSSLKTRLLIDAFLRRFGNLHYIPVDISQTILEESSLNLLNDFQNLDILAINATYKKGLKIIATKTESPRLVLFLGSNIGNFTKRKATHFLQGIREVTTASDRLLIGIDLKKSRAVLESAYDDAMGVTAAFNLNVLTRINRELGGKFDLAKFEHLSIYNDELGRIEMHLASKADQTVHIKDLNLDIQFKKGESIHTENSHKYSFDDIDELANSAGFKTEKRWLDSNEQFSLNLFAPDGK